LREIRPRDPKVVRVHLQLALRLRELLVREVVSLDCPLERGVELMNLAEDALGFRLLGANGRIAMRRDRR
jgi:hypothetical protein